MSWASFISNTSAVIASIAATITLVTFFYKDVVERRRRKRLGVATLVYQMRLLMYAIDQDEISAPLISQSALLPFADLYVVDEKALQALDAFNREYSSWQKLLAGRTNKNSDEKTAAIQALMQATQYFYPSISDTQLTTQTRQRLASQHSKLI